MTPEIRKVNAFWCLYHLKKQLRKVRLAIWDDQHQREWHQKNIVLAAEYKKDKLQRAEAKRQLEIRREARRAKENLHVRQA